MPTTMLTTVTSPPPACFLLPTTFPHRYVASVFVVLIAIVLQFVIPNENQLGTRACIFLGGLWWLLWSAWTFRWLGVRPCPDVPNSDRVWLFAKGWVQTARTFSKASKFPQTLKFLIAYFFYSDSYSTIATVGILIFQDILCMNPLFLGVVVLEVMILAVCGNIAALRIQVGLFLFLVRIAIRISISIGINISIVSTALAITITIHVTIAIAIAISVSYYRYCPGVHVERGGMHCTRSVDCGIDTFFYRYLSLPLLLVRLLFVRNRTRSFDSYT